MGAWTTRNTGTMRRRIWPTNRCLWSDGNKNLKKHQEVSAKIFLIDDVSICFTLICLTPRIQPISIHLSS